MLNVITIAMIFLGVIFIIIALIGYKSERKKRDKLYRDIEEAYTLMNNLFNDIQTESTHFNNEAEMIFKEQDEKHDELMVTYSLITELYEKVKVMLREKEVNLEAVNEQQPIKNKRIEIRDFYEIGLKSEKSKKIYELYKRGLNIEEIAKEMNIGIGEVEMLINIGKA